LSHCASAYYPSPFEEAAILTVDGVGEWATTVIAHGRGKTIQALYQLDFPHSLGLLYSAFTYYCGFKVNSGEYKLMGLAPYGNPKADRTKSWIDAIQSEMIDIRDDGSFLLNMEYFEYATGLTMCNEKKWQKLLGVPKREMESDIDQVYMDLALSIQLVTEKIMLKLAQTAKDLTGSEYLTMAGGVALNCVSNGKLLREKVFKKIWIQPAAGDAGGAIGAAYAAWHIWKQKEREICKSTDSMQGAYLGPRFSTYDIKRVLKKYETVYSLYDDFDELCERIAEEIVNGKVVGWFQGRMEFGPRALGNRSIIGDPRHPEMQKRINLKIKYREGFRPFAPSVLEEDIGEYFQLDTPSPYMLLVAPVKLSRQIPYPESHQVWDMYRRLYHLRSDIPAVTHVDYSARIQSVNRNTNKRYWKIIDAFKKRTGYGVVVNTSFNVRGEPIVRTPEDAYKCFMRTEMDFLVMENFVLDKNKQVPLKDDDDWMQEYEMD
jgi:carbamoyltransferase